MLNEIEELNLDGFQVVQAEMFAHVPRPQTPTCSIWPSRITFSTASIKSLHNCEYVLVEVNPTSKRLVVIPVLSNDKDSICWMCGRKQRSARILESKEFGNLIYQSWGLDTDYNYRAPGKLVASKGKVMLLFDFTNAYMWKSKPSVQNHD